MSRPGLAPGQLGHVGVLLLRQHRAAGGVGVVEHAEAELLARPQHQLLAHPRAGARPAGPGRRAPRPRSPGRATASREFSKRPAKPSSSATKSGSRGSEDPARAPAPSGRDVQAVDGGQQAVDVARQGPAVGQQVVGQQHRLGPLEVGVARAGRRRRPPGPAGAAPSWRAEHVVGHAPTAHRRVHRRRSVATWSLRLRPVWSLAPTSPASSVTRRSTAVWTSSSPGSEGEVAPARAPRPPGRGRSSSTATSSSVEDAGLAQALDVGPGPGQVVGGQRPVEVDADGELGHLVGHAVAQPALPQGHWPRRPGHGRRDPPWRAAQVATPSPHSRTNPSASWWRKVSRGVVGGQPVVVEGDRAAPPGHRARRPGARSAAAPRR